MSMPNDEPAYLEVAALKLYYPLRRPFFSRPQGYLKALDDVSFKVTKGQTLGIVGESGSGKTSLARTLIGLTAPTSGHIFCQGVPLVGMSKKAFFPYRKRIQMVFQDPYQSLNPRLKVKAILQEPLQIHFPTASKAATEERIAFLLQVVGLNPDDQYRYPQAFSGGQRQRIGIARALAVEPECLIFDESVSALDVSIQAQILNLLKTLQASLGLTYIFIAHDLAVVAHMSDTVAVMQGGKIIEHGPTEAIYSDPQHLYTQALLDASRWV